MPGEFPPPDPAQRDRYEPEPYAAEPATDELLRRVLMAVGGVIIVVFAAGLGLLVLRDNGDSSRPLGPMGTAPPEISNRTEAPITAAPSGAGPRTPTAVSLPPTTVAASAPSATGTTSTTVATTTATSARSTTAPASSQWPSLRPWSTRWPMISPLHRHDVVPRAQPS